MDRNLFDRMTSLSTFVLAVVAAAALGCGGGGGGGGGGTTDMSGGGDDMSGGGDDMSGGGDDMSGGGDDMSGGGDDMSGGGDDMSGGGDDMSGGGDDMSGGDDGPSLDDFLNDFNMPMGDTDFTPSALTGSTLTITESDSAILTIPNIAAGVSSVNIIGGGGGAGAGPITFTYTSLSNTTARFDFTIVSGTFTGESGSVDIGGTSYSIDLVFTSAGGGDALVRFTDMSGTTQDLGTFTLTN